MPLILNGSTGISGIDGSAGTPSYVGGDSDTGLWYPAANTVALSTSGSERLRIDSDGDVGIGSTNPIRKLQISQSIATTYTGDFDAAPNQLYIVNTNTTTNAYTGLQMDVGSNSQCAISAIRTGDGEVAMAFGTRVAGVRAERMRIDSSGNVGIGTSSPTASWRLEVKGSLSAIFNADSTANTATYGGVAFYRPTNTASNGNGFQFALNNSSSAQVEYAYIGGLIETNTAGSQNGAIIFAPTSANSRTERMRLTSGGSLLVGTTTNRGVGTFFASSGNAMGVEHSGSGTVTAIEFRQGGPSAVCGSISLSNGNATAYNTSSDHRLKENVAPMQGALATVAQLKPVTYTWKADGSHGQGFIAHELQEVVPDAVTGEKDAVNADGSIKPQGVDTSFLVATLTAAIKEQQAMIEELKAEVAALKASH